MQKVRVGIAGLGRLGWVHALHLHGNIDGAELVAACSLDGEECLRARRELGLKQVYREFDQMLREAELDAVVIATSAVAHCEQIIAALEAGKHVYTEKPLAVSYAECLRVREAVDRHPESRFMIGFMRRFDPSYAYAKEKIEAGAIGSPYLVKCTGLDPASAVEGVLRYAPTSGGLFIAMGVHDVDLIRWFLGGRITSVSAVGGCFGCPEFADFGDIEVGCALFQLDNGAMGMLHTGRTAAHGYHIETEVVGTGGSIRISPVPMKNLAMLYGPDGVLVECVDGFRTRFEEAYLLELRAFVDGILTGRDPGCGILDGLEDTLVVEAATRALRERRTLEIRY